MKIRPNKYTNTDLSVIGLSVAIMSVLEKTEAEKYNILLRKVIRKKGNLAKKNFVAALIFLYSIDKIKYHQKSDVLSKV